MRTFTKALPQLTITSEKIYPFQINRITDGLCLSPHLGSPYFVNAAAYASPRAACQIVTIHSK